MRILDLDRWLVIGLVPAAMAFCQSPALAAVSVAGHAESLGVQVDDEDDEMLQEMMVLSIDRESAEYYVDLMGLDDLQQEIAMELYREYFGQYRGMAVTMRDTVQQIEDSMKGGEGDWEKIEAMMADMMRVAVAFFDRVILLGDQFVEDLGAIAADESQQSKHARVVRTRTRELATAMSTMNGAEYGTIDLVKIARRLDAPIVPADTDDPAAAALLAYEVELDAICGPYVTRSIEAFKAMAEAMSNAKDGDFDENLEAKLERELTSMMERFDSANDRYVRRVRAALPVERQAEWDLAINRARWPEVYKPGDVDRVFDEVIAMEDLTSDQREAVEATMTLYSREAQTANTSWVEAKLELVDMRRSLSKSSEMVDWEKYKAAEELASETASARYELDARFVERLRAPLTPDQRSKLTETSVGVDVDDVLRQMGGG